MQDDAKRKSQHVADQDDQNLSTEKRAVIHSPESIVQLLNNTLHSEFDRKLIEIQGIYRDKKGKLYGTIHYYDALEDVGHGLHLTLRVPRNIKPKLSDSAFVVLQGFINRKIPTNRASELNISLHFHVHSILSNTNREPDGEESIRALVCEEKADKGYRNLEKHIELALNRENKVTIHAIFGDGAITDHDVVQGLGKEARNIEIIEHHVNLSRPDAIIKQLNDIEDDSDAIVAIVRGGGDLSVFNDIELAKSLAKMKNLTVAAIGHASDSVFIDRIVDRSFGTPTSFGEFIRHCSKNFHSSQRAESAREREINRLKDELDEAKKRKQKLEQKSEGFLEKWTQNGERISEIAQSLGAINRRHLSDNIKRRSVGSCVAITGSNYRMLGCKSWIQSSERIIGKTFRIC